MQKCNAAGLVALVLVGALLFCRPVQADSLQELLDKEEIRTLVMRYVTALDTLDADAYAGVFADDAEFDVTGTVYRGRDEIRSIVTGLQEARARAEAEGRSSASLYHVMSNSTIELVKEDEARHTSYAQTVRAAENGQFIVGFMGQYQDVIVKRDGRWQIQSRKLVSFVE